jgi:hypothetical protein
MNGFRPESYFFDPVRLGFAPASTWAPGVISLSDFTRNYLRRRSARCQFGHKLFNTLRLAECDPTLVPQLGIEWVTSDVIRVQSKVFAELLGLTSVDAALFHNQGNFPTHNFQELSFAEANSVSEAAGFGPFDVLRYRMLRHASGLFCRGDGQSAVHAAKWNRSRKAIQEKETASRASTTQAIMKG